MKRMIWLSHLLSASHPAYGDAQSLFVDKVRSIRNKDVSNLSRISISNHFGTHIDLPKHFFENGYTADNLRPDHFVFKKASVAFVKGRMEGRIINYEDIRDQITKDSDIVLIKTGFTRYLRRDVYWKRNPGLDPDIAYNLKRCHPTVRAIGVDTISISSWMDRPLGRTAHKAFLGNTGAKRPILIIEDMDLEKIKCTTRVSRLIISPLRVAGAEACLCTAIAEVSS